MITTIGLAISLLGVAQAQPKDLSVDLYLVGDNSTQIDNLNWLKDANLTDPVEKLLAPSLKPLAASGAPFVVMDWGPTSVTAKTNEYKLVKVLVRTTNTYPSMTESTTSHGVTKSHVVATTHSESTVTCGVNIQPIHDSGYVSQVNLHVAGDSQVYGEAIVQDINSYRQAMTHKDGQDNRDLPPTILISPNSIEESLSYLKSKDLPFDGVCLCEWGLSDKSAPNFAAFPPAGIAGHYKLTRHGGSWTISLVEYLR